MDINSAARDLRELSQITIDDKVSAGGGRVPSSSDVGRARSGGFKAGRGNKGEVLVPSRTELTVMNCVLHVMIVSVHFNQTTFVCFCFGI